MTHETDAKPNNERHLPFWVGLIPLLALVGVTYGAVRYYNRTGEDEGAAPSTTNPEGFISENSVATSQAGSPTESNPNTLIYSSDSRAGKVHPYTHLFYPLEPSPVGYEGYTCYGVPVDGTAFGTMLLGGPDDTTLTDISTGLFFKDGVPIHVDLNAPSSEWIDLQVVHVGDKGCSIAK